MARNKERDIRDTERRKQRMLEAGLELFSVYGIENVKLQDIADKAEAGIATLYKYYQNKVNLVIAISGYIWKNFLDKVLEKYSLETLGAMNACQQAELYCDLIIELYKEHPEILRFSGNYKTYIRRAEVSQEQLKVHLDPLKFIENMFHEKYIQAKTDGSIRTDIPEEKLYTIETVTMLSMAERYAMGIVWTDDGTGDYLQELISTKEMILDWMADRGSMQTNQSL